MRNPRITLNPNTFKMLKIWAALEDMEPSELITRLVLEYAPTEMKAVVNAVPSDEVDCPYEDEGQCLNYDRHCDCDYKDQNRCVAPI